MFITFHDKGGASVSEIDGDYPLPDGSSTLACRYQLTNGVVTDQYPGRSDADVIAALHATNAAQTTALEATHSPPATVLTRLAFMELFTSDELDAIYTAAKTVVAVEVYLDKLKVSDVIDLTNNATVAGIGRLQSAGLLTAERASAILAGCAPAAATP
ncbi:hypothetical protein ACO0K3_04835 [Undibacterium sp. Rencai35W]|uniref:hypothetical protein n=1 Tax=Undibacterium sp. Rencai35W TaxID=3413046 RepID=UPI003BF0FE84